MSKGSNACGRALATVKQRFVACSGAIVCAAAIGLMNAARADVNAPSPSMPMQRSLVSYLAQGFASIRELFWPVLAAAPRIPGEAYDATKRIVLTGDIAILWRAVLIVAFVVLLPPILRFAASHLPARAGASKPSRLLQAFLFDIMALTLLMFLAVILAELALGDDTHIARLGVALVDIALRFSIVMLAVRILLRPGEPTLRLVEADDAQVRGAMPYLAASVFLAISFITIIPLLLEAGMSWPAGQALGTMIGAIVSGLAWIAVRRFCAAAALRRPAVERGLGAAVIAVWIAWTYGVLSLDFPFYSAVISVGVVAVGAFIVDRFLLTYCNAVNSDQTNARLRWHMAQALVSIVRLAAVSGVVLIVARFLALDFPTWLGEQRWNEINQSIARATAAVFVAYVISALIGAWIRGTFVVASQYVPGEESEFQPGSRLLTVMPLLQWGITFIIIGTGVLVALDELGVNIAPLLAGAGIFGLALSFGAQSLVRDVISGLFYMADDAFRIGEYIQAGQLKGTVESISIRSVRLRHQHGPVHTVPFGQLGSVSNSSRDWLTVKFNLRLARDVDLEAVRKTVKKIGEELLADPEFAAEFLQPLKMQGVADVQEAALVVRFKFTVRPGKPTVIQRESLKRIVKAFGEHGIAFASHAVVVHGAADSQDAAAGALAGSVLGISASTRSGPRTPAADCA